MLQPTVRRTWAPKGRTPIQYSWDRRQRLSAISAVTVSAISRRLGLYFQIFDHNICAVDAEMFVAGLLQHFPRGIILVWDRWAVHRSAGVELVKRFSRRLHIEWLPAYAPELNPDEQVWNRAKYVDLANYIPQDTRRLAKAVRRSLRQTQTRQKLLRSFFKHAKLSL
jgi:transposase